MIHRTVNGVPFCIDSPSFWQVDPAVTRGHTIDVSFLGADPLPADAAPAECWCLFFGKPDGSVFTRLFPRREDAIAMLAQAFGRK